MFNDDEEEDMVKALDPAYALDLEDYLAPDCRPPSRSRVASPVPIIIDQIFAAERAKEAELALKEAKLAHRREIDRARRARARAARAAKLTKLTKPAAKTQGMPKTKRGLTDTEATSIEIAIAKADADEQIELAKYARDGRVHLREVLKNSD